MQRHKTEPCRREVLLGLCAVACTRGVPLGGGDLPATPGDTGANHDSDDSDGVALAGACQVTPGDGWVEVALADFPELREAGGSVALSDPDHLLQVIVGHAPDGCWFTAWRICTHGSCDVVYDVAARELVCPCHGSRFAETGEVLEGPADRPLTTFPTGRFGDSVWIYRPV